MYFMCHYTNEPNNSLLGGMKLIFLLVFLISVLCMNNQVGALYMHVVNKSIENLKYTG